jgi:carbon storage regulator CsrA
MLVLTRKTGEAIDIGGVTVRVLHVCHTAKRVRLGITGPREITVLREELLTENNDGRWSGETDPGDV